MKKMDWRPTSDVHHYKFGAFTVRVRSNFGHFMARWAIDVIGKVSRDLRWEPVKLKS